MDVSNIANDRYEADSHNDNRMLQMVTAGNDLDAEEQNNILVLIILWIVGVVILILLILAGIANYSAVKKLESETNQNGGNGDNDDDDEPDTTPKQQDFNYITYTLLLSPFVTSIIAIIFGILIHFNCEYVDIEDKISNPLGVVTSIGIWSVGLPNSASDGSDGDEGAVCYSPKEIDDIEEYYYNPDWIMIIVRICSLISSSLGGIGIFAYWYYIYVTLTGSFNLKILKFFTWCLAGIFGWTGFFEAITLITHATNYCFSNDDVHNTEGNIVECLTAYDGYAAATSSFYWFLAGLSLFLLWFSPVY